MLDPAQILFNQGSIDPCGQGEARNQKLIETLRSDVYWQVFLHPVNVVRVP